MVRACLGLDICIKKKSSSVQTQSPSGQHLPSPGLWVREEDGLGSSAEDETHWEGMCVCGGVLVCLCVHTHVPYLGSGTLAVGHLDEHSRQAQRKQLRGACEKTSSPKITKRGWPWSLRFRDGQRAESPALVGAVQAGPPETLDALNVLHFLIINFWLHCVFVARLAFSHCSSRGYPQSQRGRFSLQRLLLFRARALDTWAQ